VGGKVYFELEKYIPDKVLNISIAMSLRRFEKDSTRYVIGCQKEGLYNFYKSI